MGLELKVYWTIQGSYRGYVRVMEKENGNYHLGLVYWCLRGGGSESLP